MLKSVLLSILILMALHPTDALSSDACSERAITSAADVDVSDGSSFKIETFFHSKENSAIRHKYDSYRTIAVEGPQSWVRSGEKSELGTDFHKLFALGHQFHAFILHFEEIATNVTRDNEVLFDNENRQAISGDYPYGGRVHLIQSANETRPVGLLFEFPDNTVISVKLSEWVDTGGVALPFLIQIDDGDRVFDYKYTEISVAPESPLWFFAAVPAPPLGEVQVYRLHRKLLAAHCLGDADMISSLSTPKVLTANRGELEITSRDSIRTRFSALFKSLNYTEYRDTIPPTIELSPDSDFGWIGARVRASGSVLETGEKFSDQWAWIMMVKKFDNVWLHAGNASNRKE